MNVNVDQRSPSYMDGVGWEPPSKICAVISLAHPVGVIETNTCGEKIVKGWFWGIFVHQPPRLTCLVLKVFLLSLVVIIYGISGENLVLKITIFAIIQRGG